MQCFIVISSVLGMCSSQPRHRGHAAVSRSIFPIQQEQPRLWDWTHLLWDWPPAVHHNTLQCTFVSYSLITPQERQCNTKCYCLIFIKLSDACSFIRFCPLSSRCQPVTEKPIQIVRSSSLSAAAKHNFFPLNKNVSLYFSLMWLMSALVLQRIPRGGVFSISEFTDLSSDNLNWQLYIILETTPPVSQLTYGSITQFRHFTFQQICFYFLPF